MGFDDPTVRLAVLAVATGVLAGALGSWIVLRRQAFLAHASGATAFAGGATAAALALPVLPAALLTAAVAAAATGRLASRRPSATQVTTGLLLSCGLAAGVIATRSGQPQAGTSVLLGSTLLASDADILAAVAVAAIAALCAVTLGRWWLVGAVHDNPSAHSIAVGAPWLARNADLLLLLLSGVAAAALLPVAGALLAGTLLVVPAATARRIAPHPRVMVPLTGALATATVLTALVIADRTDLPPGAAAALLAAAVDLTVATALWGLRARSATGLKAATP